MENAIKELPLYKSHKKVRALKIKSIEINPNRSLDIFFEDEAYLPINEEKKSNKPMPAPGWYYVVYNDGYTSFSPPEAFEEGYSLV